MKRRDIKTVHESKKSRYIPSSRLLPTDPLLPRAGRSNEHGDSFLHQASYNLYPEGAWASNYDEILGAKFIAPPGSKPDALPSSKCLTMPPLMQARSWTRGALYRDSFDHAKPSDSIGISFSPQTRTMRTVNLPPKPAMPRKREFIPFGPNGELIFPKVKNAAEREKDRLELERKEKLKQKRTKGIIPLTELMSGDYHRRKAKEAENRRKRLLLKEQEKIRKELAAKEEANKLSAKLSCQLPLTPDEQRDILLQDITREYFESMNPDDLERIQYYLSDAITGDQLPDFPNDLYSRALSILIATTDSIKQYLLPIIYQKTIAQCETEVIKGFEDAMRHVLLAYALKDPRQVKRLRIARMPLLWPSMVVHAPVPWHTNFTLGKQRMRYRFHMGNAILQTIRTMWQERYDNIVICDINTIQSIAPFPHYLPDLSKLVTQACLEAHDRLINDWFPDIADVMVRDRRYWEHLVSDNSSDSTFLVEEFFKKIHSLMSRQIRDLVERSVNHFADLFTEYWEGNDYGREFNDYCLIKRPLLRIKVVPHEGTSEMSFDPPLDEVKNTIEAWFQEIIAVNKNLPSIDAMLYPDVKRPKPLLLEVLADEHHITAAVERAVSTFLANRPGPEAYLSEYEPYHYLLDGIAMEHLLEFFKIEPFPFLHEFKRRIVEYENTWREVSLLREDIPLHLVQLDCQLVNERLRADALALKQYIVDYFMLENRHHNRTMCTAYDEMSSRASEVPDGTAQLVELLSYVHTCYDVTIHELKLQTRVAAEKVLFLMDLAHLSPEDIVLNTRVFLWPRDIEETLSLTEKTLATKRNMAEDALRTRRALCEDALRKREKDLDVFRRLDPPLLNIDLMTDYVGRIDDIYGKLLEDKHEADSIVSEETLLEVEAAGFFTLQSMLHSAELFHQLWHIALDFHVGYEHWYYGEFKSVDATLVTEQVEGWFKSLLNLAKQLQGWAGARRVVDVLKSRVDNARALLPVLQTICNPGMQERHWEAVSLELGAAVSPDTCRSLAEVVELGAPAHASALADISRVAAAEHALECALSAMKAEWADVRFLIVMYRDTGVGILSSLDDIQQMLDDHILKAQTMRGSPYVKPFEAEMQAWEEKLISMQDILDQWLLCQSTWMYLEAIFSSEDIMRQMPNEARAFRDVDRSWRAIMSSAAKEPLVLRATAQADLLAKLLNNNALLDEIQRGLNDYLEKKRLIFPRFFFLSNDELLEILSETKDPTRVQPHLKKCFEGINSLEFSREGEVITMVSAEGEVVPLSSTIQPADAKGMVERWLVQLELQMSVSLRDVGGEALAAYSVRPRHDWVLDWPAQLIQLISLVYYTTEVTLAINNKELGTQHARCCDQVDALVRLVRADMDPGTRSAVEALIVLDVHGRDQVKMLEDRGVSAITEFPWFAALRYYWSGPSVTARMLAAEMTYAFEYLGACPRLVRTPLTDRCYRTLIGALHLRLSGAPEGPAGTGKTESVKDLARAVAKKCVVFNCSDGLDYKALAKFFKGLAQSGAWSCFDEFNRIGLEVLSVVAAQLLCIQTAVQRGLKRFVFDGTEIALNATCAVFITMNPGYAGRSELPDNLKVLFRPVAMMVPDYAMIAEITLYSNGFISARPLSQKLVAMYRLCSEQLSSNSHYDYGMRAVKAVLSACGALRRARPDLHEGKLMLRAIVDVNLPKFLSQDVPLFEGICSDLFPGIELPQPDRAELMKCVDTELQRRNLQATPYFLEKILQVYEMMLVRHGFMIVGAAMSGKTCSYQVLAESLKALATQRPAAKHREFIVGYRIINPKSITLDQLYGCFDVASHQWSDGILAISFREFASPQAIVTRERRWLMFDGPVDAAWLENMNTVLDDNKKLCLASGEIIQMTNKMNLMFETADLRHASPATVSRCGMVYMEPTRLGWQSLHESYLSVLESRLIPEQLELVRELTEWLVPAIMEFLHDNCKHFILLGEIHHYHSYARLMSSFLEGEGASFSTVWLQCVFIFSLLWGFCSTITGESRKSFDVFFRKLLDGNDKDYPKPKLFKLAKNHLFPEKGLVFDFLYDKKNNGTWLVWTDTEKELPIPPNAKASEIQVLTNESACMSFFVHLPAPRAPVLLLGPTGTGKSSAALHRIATLSPKHFVLNTLNFSARTTAQQTQEIIMSKVDRRRKGVFGPSMGKKCFLFVDDLSMPALEEWDAQPPLELLRQWLDHGYWYDLKDMTRQEVVDVIMVFAMLPPGGGCNPIPLRLARHALILAQDALPDRSLTKIFGAIIDWHFAEGFPEPVQRMSKGIVGATVEVLNAVRARFPATVGRAHYAWSVRDAARAVRGVLLVPPPRLQATTKLLALWLHELYRAFHDRLIDDSDREALFKMVESATYNNYRVHLDQQLREAGLLGEDEAMTQTHLQDIFFGSYMEPDAVPKVYDQVNDLEEMADKMEYYQNEYNALSSSPMHLVMFNYALHHISRACRVLLQDQGNLVMAGVGGSGRTSAVKLACSILEIPVMQIEVGRAYGQNEWRTDVRTALLRAGLPGRPFTFLLADTQLTHDAMLDDVNTLLSAADIPNLYQSEDRADILDKMMAVAREMGQTMDTSPAALFALYVSRVRGALRVALAMSPSGESFAARLRMFPALLSNCTIDWYAAWPEEALSRVADRFMSQLDGVSEERRMACVTMCRMFHTSAGELAHRFLSEQNRIVYTTPTSYLELIKGFLSLYKIKVDQITKSRNRYETGLEQLQHASQQVTAMQLQLSDLHPQLLETSDKTEKLMIKIEQDTVIVEKQKEIVGADEALANEAAAAAQAIKDDCEGDLAEAVPALQAAVSALNTLRPADITLVKSMRNPPGGVKLVLEAVCVMKAIKPDKKPDAMGRMVEDYWGPSVKMMSDMKFLESLVTFDKDNIAPAIMKKIRDKFIPDRDFDPVVVAKSSSACEGLCRWVRAMDIYDRVIKVVAPKKAALAEAEAELQAQMNTLNNKRAQLQSVLDKLQALNDEFAEYTRKKKGLEDEIAVCDAKLRRAEKLIGGLGGERDRWGQLATHLQGELHNVVGDVLLSAGFIAYLGPFTLQYRQDIVEMWNQKCQELSIPCSVTFTLGGTLGEGVQTRSWLLAGLPADAFSLDNALVVTHARRCPLIIDPQGQANAWIRQTERPRGLRVLRPSDPGLGRAVESALRLGHPLLLEDAADTLDATLDPVLTINVFKSGGMDCIKVGDNVIEYNANFRLYITTRLRNPHYLPEVAVKVTLVNFMITPGGLREQLLGIVTARECPELERRRNDLIVESANNQKKLKEIEDEILEVLSAAENILEDEWASEVLSSSKALSRALVVRQEAAAAAERETDAARRQYVPPATLAAALQAAVDQISAIDPMYQYSLQWFINLYEQAIENSTPSPDLEKRMEFVNQYFIKSIYENVCLSLFEKDKLIFSFVLAISLLRSKGSIDEEELLFFLTGGVDLAEPLPSEVSWLSDKSWAEIGRASQLKRLPQFKENFLERIDEWQAIYDSAEPGLIPYPEPYTRIKGLPKLIIMRCIRGDQLCQSVHAFVLEQLGEEVLEAGAEAGGGLARALAASSARTPIVLVLAPGADPSHALLLLAERHKLDTFETVSLGQGQGAVAEEALSRVMKSGGWVVLQNCHLMASWMARLQQLCADELQAPDVHPACRLWLTSYPSPDFPVSVLQNGVKLTIQSGAGLRGRLVRAYCSEPLSDTSFYESVPMMGRRLLFALCFFHAALLERRSYGPLGFNIPYSFEDSDLNICIAQLQEYMCEYIDSPHSALEALTYLAGECNYGGRVTDQNDRRLLTALLLNFYNRQVLEESEYPLSSCGQYSVPARLERDNVLEYVRALPLSASPAALGLHANAAIARDHADSLHLLHGTLAAQGAGGGVGVGAGAGAGGPSAEELCEDILSRLPHLYDVEAARRDHPTRYEDTMNTVLVQELLRYNVLLEAISSTLRGVMAAVRGLSAMDEILRVAHDAMLRNFTPPRWAKVSYPSRKPLASYIADLIHRLKFLQNWLDEGPPIVFWISGFFFTQSFLTGVLQNFSRNRHISIDLIQFEFEVTNYEYDSSDGPPFGVYVRGFFLEATRWNRKTKMLDESLPKVLFDSIPVIWFKPAQIQPDGVKWSGYSCPVYRTAERRGILATTGHSTNFVMYLNLPSDKPERHWISRGAAALSMLDD